MAENLGTIDIAVKSDDKQVTDTFNKAFADGGRVAGKSISDSIGSVLGRVMGGAGRGIGRLTEGAVSKVYGVGGMRGPEAGPTKYGTPFGSMMKGSMGATRVGAIAGKIGAIAGPIAIAVGAVAVLGVIVKKIISGFVNLAKSLENMAHKFSGINAELAMLSAGKKLSALARDMRFAHMIAPAVKQASDAMGGLKDAIVPLKAYFMTIFQSIGSEVIGLVTDVINSFVSLLKAFAPLIKVVLTITKVIARVLRIAILFLISPIAFIKGLITGENLHLFDLDGLKEEIAGSNEALDRILGEIKEGKDQQWVENWNAYLANVGTQLSGGSWSPKFNKQYIPPPPPSTSNQSSIPSYTKTRRGMGGGGGITG